MADFLAGASLFGFVLSLVVVVIVVVAIAVACCCPKLLGCAATAPIAEEGRRALVHPEAAPQPEVARIIC